MPDWKQLIRRRLAALNLPPAREAEIVEEFAEHAEDRYQELLRDGVLPADAQQIALEESGDGAQLRPVEPPMPADPPRVFRGGWLRDIRYGWRTLRQSPGFTAVVCAVLAIGIGANVAMFTVVDAAFLRPLDFPQPERLVQVQETPPGGGLSPVAYPNFVDWQKQSRSFESIGFGAAYEETLKRSGGNERIQVAYVSADFHRAYGVQAVVGRLLTASDDRPGAAPAAVLSSELWHSHFGGDPAVIGKTITTDDQVWTIVGVLAPFRWQHNARMFVPVSLGIEKFGFNLREQHSSSGVTARLKAGVGLDQARSEMNVIAARLAKEYPGSNGGYGAAVLPLRDFVGGGVRDPALLMFGVVGLLLLVACANVAGLLLARAAVRQREIAIRIALGASRVQLIRQLLTESLLLAGMGALCGIGVAWVSFSGLRRIFPAVDSLGGIGLDPRVLLFSIAAAILTAVLFGLAPAVQLTRPDVTEAIKSGGRSSHGSALRVHTRKLLVVSQVALAVMLSIGSGLLIRSLLRVLETQPGFVPDHTVVARIVPPDRKTADLSMNGRLFREASERLAALPGVAAAGAIDCLPFDNADSSGDFYRDDRPVPEAGKVPTALKAAATAGYFPAMGIPLIRGRLFAPTDARMPPLKRDFTSVLKYVRSAEWVAVINETMARRFWPGEDPIGKAFRFGPPSMQGPRVRIIGVVGDHRQQGLDQPVYPQYFFSADQFPVLEGRLVVRTQQDAAALAPTLRKIVAEIQPDAVVMRVQTLDGLIHQSLNDRQNNVLLLGLFSGVSLLLAAFGLYATMAYVVAQRTQEIGVRMALGAAASDVRTMVIREGGRLACVGALLGLVAALLGARVLESMLYGVTTTDVSTYAGSVALLLLIMLAASYIPAWRASRVDPISALRAE